MALPEWNRLTVKERRKLPALYERIRQEVNGESEEEPPVEVPVTSTRNISITVNDGTDPVEGASVSIDEISGTTGSAGGCTLQGVADGEQTIHVVATGFEEYSGTITVSENDTSFTISLTAAVAQGTG